MPSSDEWLRVQQPETGHHITVHKSVADTFPELAPVDNQDSALTADGKPRPPKYRVDKGPSRTKTATAATKKES